MIHAHSQSDTAHMMFHTTEPGYCKGLKYFKDNWKCLQINVFSTFSTSTVQYDPLFVVRLKL